MKFCVLASGSQGNATYVEGGGVRLLIDAGLSCRALEQRLAAVGVSPDGLDGILVTHEHVDHVKGLSRFCERYGVPVYANEGTAAVVERQCRLEKKRVPEWAIFESSVPFVLGELVVQSIRISHDTAEPVAFTLTGERGKLGYFTDLGVASRMVASALGGCTALVLESNHDLEMLRHSGRPYSLIARIQGASGHLSNDQAGELLAQACPETLRRLVLAHLSRDCNEPAVARVGAERVLRAIDRADVPVMVARQDEALEMMEV